MDDDRRRDERAHQGRDDSRDGHDGPPPPPPRTVDFSGGRLRRDLWIDAVMRTAVMVAVIGAAIFIFAYEGEANVWSSLAVLVVLVVWLAVNAVSARASRDLPAIAALLDTDPAAAEHRIAENLSRRPLLRWVRLMLHHRLAVLRHRQQRWADSAEICDAVLAYPLGPARQARPHLLLMLAEARLQLDQPALAYPPLRELHGLELGLAESLQRMALQTRYEVAMGRHAEALRDARRKVELAELLPAAQCGAMHALLATAAQHADQPDFARWLWARAELLLTPAQLQHITSGQFGIGVVDAVRT